MRTVFALFKDYDNARDAVGEMEDKGISLDEMNAIAPDYVAKSHMDVNLREIKVDVSGKFGREVRGLARLIGGKQAVRISDIGDVYAAGKIAGILARGNCEPVYSCNGLKPALIDMDIPEDIAETYSTGIKGGGVLVFVRSEDDRAPEVAGVMRTHKGEGVRSFLH